MPGVEDTASQPLHTVEGTISKHKTRTTEWGVEEEDVVIPTSRGGIRTFTAAWMIGGTSTVRDESHRSAGGHEDRN